MANSHSLDAVTLAFQVQDSALAEYWLFHHGRELDHYFSNSAYFSGYAQRADVTADMGLFDGFGPDVTNDNPTEEDVSDGGNGSRAYRRERLVMIHPPRR